MEVPQQKSRQNPIAGLLHQPFWDVLADCDRILLAGLTFLPNLRHYVLLRN
jgi:hypothetical protein